MTHVFISYRREDSAMASGRIYDHLANKFGDSNVFMDVTNIDVGDDFVVAIENAVGSCDLLIAVIGDKWERIVDKQGRRRIDNVNDYVRLEIATALKRNIKVIPVLIDGAEMPNPDELPANLVPLTRRNAVTLNSAHFRDEIVKLITAVEKILTSSDIVVKPAALQIQGHSNPIETTKLQNSLWLEHPMIVKHALLIKQGVPLPTETIFEFSSNHLIMLMGIISTEGSLSETKKNGFNLSFLIGEESPSIIQGFNFGDAAKFSNLKEVGSINISGHPPLPKLKICVDMKQVLTVYKLDPSNNLLLHPSPILVKSLDANQSF